MELTLNPDNLKLTFIGVKDREAYPQFYWGFSKLIVDFEWDHDASDNSIKFEWPKNLPNQSSHLHRG